MAPYKFITYLLTYLPELKPLNDHVRRNVRGLSQDQNCTRSPNSRKRCRWQSTLYI